jgi:hypothetical protein
LPLYSDVAAAFFSSTSMPQTGSLAIWLTSFHQELLTPFQSTTPWVVV